MSVAVRSRLDAYGVEADISQPTISAETVENDPKATSGVEGFGGVACGGLHVTTDALHLIYILVDLVPKMQEARRVKGQGDAAGEFRPQK